MVLLSGVAMGQENVPAPSQLGAYDLFGTLKAGYRMVTVNSGDQTGDYYKLNAQNLFHEQYNLTDSGFALGKQLPLSLNIYGTKREGEKGFFDQLFLNADFNPTVAGGSLRLRQFNAYDFNISYKHVDQFFDRYDSLYRDMRRYESNRNDLSAGLNITATDFLDVNFDYRMIGHGGTLDLPRAMFVEGAPEGFGTSSSTNRNFFNVFRNYYLTELPREDLNNEFSGSLNAHFDMIDVNVGAGYTNYTEDYAIAPVATADSLPMNFLDTNNRSNNKANGFGVVGDRTSRERLHTYSHTENRELSGPFVFGSALIKPADIFSLKADFRLDMLEGNTDVVVHQLVESPKTSAAKAFQLYRSHYAGTVDSKLDQTKVSVVGTLDPIPEVSVSAGWKMDRHELTSDATYHLSFDTTSNTSEVASFASVLGSADSVKAMEWAVENLQPTQTFFGTITFAPMKELSLSAGVKAWTRKPEVTRDEDGEGDSVVANNMSKETSSIGFDFGASYRPMRELRLGGRFEMENREAKFSAVKAGEKQGPAAGTVTDMEPRTTPEKKIRFNASATWDVTEAFSAGVRFGMQNGSSDLTESMWVTDGPTEKVELKDNWSNLSATFIYRVDDNTSIHLAGETRSQDFSIPVTWTRGQEMITPIYGLDPTAPVGGGFSDVDSATVLLSQKTDDIFVDFGFDTKLIDALSLGAGVSFLKVTGEPTISPEVKATSSTPTKQGDVTRVGGPFDRMIVNGNVGYDITKQFGIAVDLMYALQNEDQILDDGALATRRFYGIDDYNGLAAAFSVVYNF
jgi:hypothetical protein